MSLRKHICPKCDQVVANLEKHHQEARAFAMSAANDCIAVIDTETTGIKRGARIVEIGVGLWRASDRALIKMWSSIVRPDGFEIPAETVAIHHISTEHARTCGIPIADALGTVASLIGTRAKLIVGHNLPFDLERITEEINRAPSACAGISGILCAIPHYDTHAEAKVAWGRSGRLGVLFERLTGKKAIDAHRVDGDIRMTCEIFFAMVPNGDPSAARTTMPTSAKLPDPSDEQQVALDLFAQGKNLLIDSVAGGGKTTFVLHLARAAKVPVLFLTYNKRLRDETHERARFLGLENLEVYTYHGFCVKFYGQPCQNDHQMAQLLASAQQLALAKFRALIVDEAQDMIPLYFRLVTSISAGFTQMCFIGDKHQTIYTFNGADSRFLTMAESIYGRPFVECTFKRTFRCTRAMARFVNTILNTPEDKPRMISDREGPPVKWVIADIFNEAQCPDVVMQKVREYGLEGVLILLPSVRAKPYAILTNALSRRGVNVYIPLSDEGVPNAEAMRGKLVVLTYHQSKGLERDCVFVFAFECAYFTYYARDQSPHQLCNAQYVALTRARRELIVVQAHRGIALPFAMRARSQCEVDALCRAPPVKSCGDEAAVLSVSNLIRFKSYETVERVFEIVKPTHMREGNADIIDIPITTAGRAGCIEEVSDITGVALPLAFWRSMGREILCDPCIKLDDLQKSREAERKRMRAEFRIPTNPITPAEIAKFAAYICAVHSMRKHKLMQITRWDWITEDHRASAVARLRAEIGAGGVCEVPVWRDLPDGRRIFGVIDWVVQRGDMMVYYEIKCVKELRNEHFLQLALYAFIVFDARKKQEFRLFNVMNNEIATIATSEHGLRDACDIILSDTTTHDYNDEEFAEYAARLAVCGSPPVLDKTSSDDTFVLGDDT